MADLMDLTEIDLTEAQAKRYETCMVHIKTCTQQKTAKKYCKAWAQADTKQFEDEGQGQGEDEDDVDGY